MTSPKASLLALLVTCCVGSQAFGIERVAARFSYLELRSSYAMPQGEYDGLPGMDFLFDDTELVTFDANKVFDDGFAFGLTYGQMLGGNWRASVGFDYARNKIKNPILQQKGIYEYRITFLDDETYQQYDLTFRGAYSPTNLAQTPLSPYVGLGASAGLSSATAPGYENELEFNLGVSLDFGLDVKLWQAADNRSFVALSSINSWNFLTTAERISHLQVGGGIRYFFKP